MSKARKSSNRAGTVVSKNNAKTRVLEQLLESDGIFIPSKMISRRYVGGLKAPRRIAKKAVRTTFPLRAGVPGETQEKREQTLHGLLELVSFCDIGDI